MGRLTKRLEDGRARVIDLDSISNPDKLYELIDHLAAYEDTGLEPEKITEHEAAFIEITSWTYGPLHQKIGQWLRADREGRLVVLPHKIVCGTIIWWADSTIHTTPHECEVVSLAIYTGPNGELQVWMNCCIYGPNLESGKFRMSDIGKTVFLTYEEAETVLKGGEG